MKHISRLRSCEYVSPPKQTKYLPRKLYEVPVAETISILWQVTPCSLTQIFPMFQRNVLYQSSRQNGVQFCQLRILIMCILYNNSYVQKINKILYILRTNQSLYIVYIYPTRTEYKILTLHLSRTTLMMSRNIAILTP